MATLAEWRARRTAEREYGDRAGIPRPENDDLDEPENQPENDEEKPGRVPVQVSTGAGWLLGLLLWGWVLLPFVKGGPVAVKNVWMAKFLNKAPDGSALP